MAIMTFTLEDIDPEDGLIRFKFDSDTDVADDSTPITPAMAIMALLLDRFAEIQQEMLEDTDKKAMH